MRTCGSIFSGGGGWELGAIEVGYRPLWGIENDPVVAASYRQNIGNVYEMDVSRIDTKKLPPVDVLFASPPCQGYSIARTTRNVATRGDELLGLYIIPFAKLLRPKAILIENVPAYQKSDVFRQIFVELANSGYMGSFMTLEASDFGLPSLRTRFYAAFVQTGVSFRWPAAHRRQSWDKALADMQFTRQEELAPWQKQGIIARPPQKWPLFVTGGHRYPVKTAAGEVRAGHYEPGRPAPAVLASAASMSGTRICYSPKECFRVGPRGLAKLMAFPDNYVLPANESAAYTIVGNAVSPLMSRTLLAGLSIPR